MLATSTQDKYLHKKYTCRLVAQTTPTRYDMDDCDIGSSQLQVEHSSNVMPEYEVISTHFGSLQGVRLLEHFLFSRRSRCRLRLMKPGMWLCERSDMDGAMILLVADHQLPKDSLSPAKSDPRDQSYELRFSWLRLSEPAFVGFLISVFQCVFKIHPPLSIPCLPQELDFSDSLHVETRLSSG